MLFSEYEENILLSFCNVLTTYLSITLHSQSMIVFSVLSYIIAIIATSTCIVLVCIMFIVACYGSEAIWAVALTIIHSVQKYITIANYMHISVNSEYIYTLTGFTAYSKARSHEKCHSIYQVHHIVRDN